MKTEVHVHGSVFLCKGVRLAQVELALRPWLDYVDADHLADAKSLEREEIQGRLHCARCAESECDIASCR